MEVKIPYITWIIVMGNVVNGLGFLGFWEDANEAKKYGEHIFRDSTTPWVVTYMTAQPGVRDYA